MIADLDIRIGDMVILADGRRLKIEEVGAELGTPGDDVRRARIVIRGWTCTASGRLLGAGWAYLDAIIERTEAHVVRAPARLRHPEKERAV
jgi:hypothetical protein